MKNASFVLWSKFKEALFSILPIFIVILILGLTITPLSVAQLVTFVVSSVLMVFGLMLFTNGAEGSMLLMGQNIGGSLSKARRFLVFILSSLVLGTIITIAEPDLMVFAGQITSINKWAIIITVGLGSGFFTLLAVLRIIFQVKIKVVLFICYAVILVLLFFIPHDMIAIAFDASGVTTGPISSPFILSFGLGVSAVRASKKSQEDSFGLIAIASVGPILFMSILALFLKDATIVSAATQVVESGTNFVSIATLFGQNMLEFSRDVGIVILAILVIFFAFNATLLKLPISKIKKILMGLMVTFVGIVIYLTGVKVGYLPVSTVIGTTLMNYGLPLIIPLMLVVGFAIVLAEPAVHVLISKVYEITNGAISKKIMILALAISMAMALILSVLKAVFNLDMLYIILPLYGVILLLMFFTPQIFIAIAFDSGGVASGPMATSFLLPLTLGIASVSSSANYDAFGTIGIISAMPLLTIQMIGLIFKIHQKYRVNKVQQTKRNKNLKVEIVEFSE